MKKMIRVILVLDVGTTNLKAVMYDAEGNMLFMCSANTTPAYLADDRVEMDGRVFRTKVVSMLTEACRYADDQGFAPDAISVTAQRSSVMAVDSQGEPLSPFIMWQDKRTLDICRKLADADTLVYQRTGLKVSPVFSGVKMRWLQQEAPGLMARATKLIGFQDYVLHILCDKFVTDYTFASRTNLFNLSTLAWDEELLALFDIEKRLLCDLVPPGVVCGLVSERIAMLTGLPSGLPVVTAGGDQQCAAVGNGVFDSSKLLCNTGTASYLIGVSDAVLLDPKKRFFCNASAVPGKYILEAGLQTSGALYRWIAEQFYREYQEADRFVHLDADIEQVPPGAHGVIVLPHFEGSGCPYWNVSDTGVIYNLSLGTSRADVARAVLESIALEMNESLLIFRSFLKSKGPLSIRAAGGMTGFGCFNQLLADVFSADVTAGTDVQATSRGAWIAAAVALGMFRTYVEAYDRAVDSQSLKLYLPEASKTLLYQTISRKRTKLYQALHSLVD
jgi:sugar (pentulose or hexulose) kinase